MVVEIQCGVNSTNQHVQRPSPAPESSGPLEKVAYYEQTSMKLAPHKNK